MSLIAKPKKSFYPFVAIALTLTVGSSVSFARSGTLGDLLKKIEKNKISKSRTAIPEYRSYNPKAKPRYVNRVKPPGNISLYYEKGTNEAELEQILDKGIKQLYGLSQKYKRSPQRGEVWLRLAELYTEKSKIIEFKVQNDYDKDLKAYYEKKRSTKPSISLKASQSYNKKAIQLYDWFSRDFPKDPKIEQALFFLGFNNFELGNTKKGESYYRQLLKRYPKSQYVPESRFALGEYYFDEEDWSKSEAYYKAVVGSKDPIMSSMARYKLSWAQFKGARYKSALSNLQKVIYKGRSSGSKKSRTAQIAKEAIKDMPMFYAEAGDYKKARSYFSKVVGTKSADGLTERLAYQMANKGDNVASANLLKSLISSGVKSSKGYDFQKKIVESFANDPRKGVFQKEMQSWLKSFGPKSSNATQAHTDEMEGILRKQALNSHSIAQKALTRDSMEKSALSYKLYLSHFATHKNAHEMNFLYGELLYDLKKYNEAGKQYEILITRFPNSPYYEKALYNTIISLDKELPTAAEFEKRVGNKKEPITMKSEVVSFINVGNKYLAKAPESKDTLKVKHRIGVLHYYHNNFDKALPIFESIIKSSPSSEYAKYSSNLILDIYKLKGDYAALEKAADSILVTPGLSQSADLASEVKTVKETAILKQAEAYEKSKDYVKAAQEYASFYKANPTSKYRFEALYNSAINYTAAKDLDKTNSTYLALLKTQAKPELKKKALTYLADTYYKMGDYRSAVGLFENYVQRHRQDPLAQDYLYNAAIIRSALGDTQKAVTHYNSYYSKTTKNDRADVLYEIAKIYDQQKQASNARSYYERYVAAAGAKPSNVMTSMYRVAESYKDQRQTSMADTWYRKLLSERSRLARSAGNKRLGYPEAADAEFNFALQKYAQLKSMVIPADPKLQAQVVQNKLKLVNSLRDDLKKIIKYDSGEAIVKALSLQGDMMKHLADSISGAPLPPNLNPTDLITYKEGVDKVVSPFYKESNESYVAAHKKGYDLNTYGPALDAVSRIAKNIDPKLRLKNRGEYFFNLQRFEAPNIASLNVAELQKELLVKPEDKELLSKLAYYYFKKNDLGLSRLSIERALYSSKNDLTLKTNLAYIMQKQGQDKDASVLLTQILKRNSSFAPASLNMATIAINNKDYKRALRLLSVSKSNWPARVEAKSLKAAQEINNYSLLESSVGDKKAGVKSISLIKPFLNSDRVLPYSYALISFYYQNKKSTALKVLKNIKPGVGPGDLDNKINNLKNTIARAK